MGFFHTEMDSDKEKRRLVSGIPHGLLSSLKSRYKNRSLDGYGWISLEQVAHIIEMVKYEQKSMKISESSVKTSDESR